MNDSTMNAPGAEGGEAREAGRSEDGPSTPAQPVQDRPKLFERFARLFRPRNGGSSIREDLEDALAVSA